MSRVVEEAWFEELTVVDKEAVKDAPRLPRELALDKLVEFTEFTPRSCCNLPANPYKYEEMEAEAT